MLVAPASGERQVASPLRPLLRASDAELRRLDRGEPITRTVQSADSREITTVGAIRVACTADTYLARVRDIERFKAGEYLIQIGRFSSPPVPSDVERLTLDDGDRQALRACREGDCAVRLPADAINRLRSAIPWGQPNESEAATAEMRAFVAREAASYWSSGSGGLAPYADQADRLSRAQAFHALLRPSAFGAEYQPEMFAFLDRFPSGTAEGVENILYWSQERFGLKPMIAITHSAILTRRDKVIFASKQVYGSHYLDASLGLSVFVSIPETGGGYLTYMNRSRVEGLHGALAPLARAIASRRGRDGLERTLMDVRRKLETNGR